tara:strand:+ start:44 stop:2668 length:2625 start_codon:yes stop_codon:yes gene_type:complete
MSDQSLKVYDLIGKYIPVDGTSAIAGNEIPVHAKVINKLNVTSITSNSSGVATITCEDRSGENLATLDKIVIEGASDSTFNGTFTTVVPHLSPNTEIPLLENTFTPSTTVNNSGITCYKIHEPSLAYFNVPSGSTAQETFGATTVADFTFLLNRKKTVTKGSTYSHKRPFEAYIYVKNGDYKSTYRVKVTNAAGTSHEVAVTTPDGVIKSNSTESGNTTNTTQINNQAAVSTQVIAKALATGSSGLTATGNSPDVITDLTFATVDINSVTTNKSLSTPSTGENDSHLNGKLGSSFNTIYNANENYIYIYSATDNFDIEVSDGRGNEDIEVYVGHDQVSSFGKLPATLPKDAEKGWTGSVFNTTDLGFTIKVGGDTQKAQDDYYVYWNGKTWKETLLPRYGNITDLDPYKTSFDASTMPHQLKKQFDGNKVYFVLEESPWVERKVGNIDTNPFPSFTDFEINDVFFFRNRLGFLSDENVIFSESGGFYNLFTTTTLTILDSEPIDVAVSNNQVSILRHAIPFNESLLIFSDLQQFKVTAGELLTPTSVSIDIATNFETDTKAKPVPAGRYVYFPFKRGDFSGVREYFLDISTETSDAQEVTAHVPEYIDGNIIQLASSSNEEILLALANTDQKNIYVYKYFWSGSEKLQSSWSKWIFDGTILSFSILGSDVYLLIRRSNSLFLEKLTLSSDPASSVMDDNQSIHLDRRVELKTGGTTTLPYTDNTAQYILETGKIITSSDVATQLAAGKSVFAGIPFTFKYRVSEQVHKENDVTVDIARLQIRNMSFNFNETGFFEVIVSPLPSTARTSRTNTFSGLVVGTAVLDKQALQAGTFRVPVLSKSDNVTIEIQNAKHLPCRFQSAEYEGFLVVRSPRS